MKKRFGVGVILLIGLVLVLSVLAARLPVNGQDSGAWGTLLNGFLDAAHDTGGNIKSGYITTTMIADNTIAGVDILDNTIAGVDIANATIEAIDIAADTINATHLTAVSRLVFGHCTKDVPAFAAATFSNDTVANWTAAGNCTISGASSGDAVIITPSYSRADIEKMSTNLTINGAIIMGSNLSINFTRTGDGVAALPQSSHVRFNYIVFLNGSG